MSVDPHIFLNSGSVISTGSLYVRLIDQVSDNINSSQYA